ncbi:hypothetical protein [Algoriphagus sediminis]|uniref:VLRF1 domain-containing protein n=1 Tax=Algoriphagus sediminis TaxID=3057113 RepID=A0ABT7YDA7_9BACT|nr:hypothetical protein [Algoriphagus sediminis]MDN3204463.1 hypothetical protein [Algoriphagus sediminis]
MVRTGNLRKIFRNQFDEIMNFAKEENFDVNFDYKRHHFEIISDQQSIAKIFLPIDQTVGQNYSLKEKEDFFLPICVIKAGQAFLCLFHNSELIDHKVFRAYMVRKKQGKSQVKHLKTKGKSRLGSRIRLSETERFFLEINKRLNSYNEHPIERWALSCSKTLFPLLFDSEIPPPFDSKSKSIYKIPFHIAEAKFEIYEELYKQLCSFHLSVNENANDIFEPFIEKNQKLDSDDW